MSTILVSDDAAAAPSNTGLRARDSEESRRKTQLRTRCRQPPATTRTLDLERIGAIAL